MSSYVYRLYDHAGALLYIGVTDDIQRRLREHLKTKLWGDEIAIAELVEYEKRCDAEWAESNAIALEKPHYNVFFGRGPRLNLAARAANIRIVEREPAPYGSIPLDTAADHLGIPPKNFERSMLDLAYKFVEINHRKYVDVRDVAEWLDRCTVRPSA